MVVENAFGRLKGRWRCLLKRLDFKLDNVANVVAACVVLHNMCEMYGDLCLQEWTYEEQPNPTAVMASSSTSESNASQVRDAIVRHFQQ